MGLPLRYRSFLALLFFFPRSVFASEWLVADSGMAMASHANPDSFSSIAYQPALIALVPKYQIAAAGGLGFEEIQNPSWNVGGAAVDSNSPVSAGFLYGRYLRSNSEELQLPGWRLPDQELSMNLLTTDLGGAVGISFAQRTSSLGVSLLYSSNKGDQRETQERLNVTLSAGLRLFDQLLMGVALTDLGDRFEQRGVDVGIRWGPLDPSLVKRLGSQYHDLPFRSLGGLELDFFVSDNGQLERLGVSADCFVFDVLTLRTGILFEQEEGFEWQSPQLGIGAGVGTETSIFEYSLRYNQGFQEHLLGIRVRL